MQPEAQQGPITLDTAAVAPAPGDTGDCAAGSSVESPSNPSVGQDGLGCHHAGCAPKRSISLEPGVVADACAAGHLFKTNHLVSVP